MSKISNKMNKNMYLRETLEILSSKEYNNKL